MYASVLPKKSPSRLPAFVTIFDVVHPFIVFSRNEGRAKTEDESSREFHDRNVTTELISYFVNSSVESM